MKVQELRDALKLRGLDTTGLRAALVERLEAALKEEEANATAPDAKAAPMEAVVKSDQLSGPPAPLTEAPAAGGPLGTSAIAGEAGDTKPAEASGDGVQDPDALVSKGTVSEEKASDANGVPAGSMTDQEKKQKRAARFGVPLVVPEDDKKKARAQKFGSADEQQKKSARAAKFGSTEAAGSSVPIVSAKLSDEEEAKRKSRADRFGPTTGEPEKADESSRAARAEQRGAKEALPKEELDKARKRAEKFGIPLKPDVDLEARKKQRAERFGPAVATA